MLFIFYAIVVCIMRFFKYRWVMFGALFFTINIAIALHIIPIARFSIVADRYAYLSYVGLAFMLSYGLIFVCRKVSTVWRMALTTFFTGYVLFMGIYANQCTRAWHDSDALKKELRELIQQRNDYQLFINTEK